MTLAGVERARWSMFKKVYRIETHHIIRGHAIFPMYTIDPCERNAPKSLAKLATDYLHPIVRLQMQQRKPKNQDPLSLLHLLHLGNCLVVSSKEMLENQECLPAQ